MREEESKASITTHDTIAKMIIDLTVCLAEPLGVVVVMWL